jgi:hypothetical protein
MRARERPTEMPIVAPEERPVLLAAAVGGVEVEVCAEDDVDVKVEVEAEELELEELVEEAKT